MSLSVTLHRLSTSSTQSTSSIPVHLIHLENSTPNLRCFSLDINRIATMIFMLRLGESVMLFFDN